MTAAAATIQDTPRRRQRRKRFYYEIHLSDGYVVSDTELFTGMLEAERAVNECATEIVTRVQKPLRGCLIMEARLLK